jgi:hypothetical protein
VVDQNGGIPGNNAFVLNDLTGFQSSAADVFVDLGVTQTVIVGLQSSIEDHGAGTIVIPLN